MAPPGHRLGRRALGQPGSADWSRVVPRPGGVRSVGRLNRWRAVGRGRGRVVVIVRQFPLQSCRRLAVGRARASAPRANHQRRHLATTGGGCRSARLLQLLSSQDAPANMNVRCSTHHRPHPPLQLIAAARPTTTPRARTSLPTHARLPDLTRHSVQQKLNLTNGN